MVDEVIAEVENGAHDLLVAGALPEAEPQLGARRHHGAVAAGLPHLYPHRPRAVARTIDEVRHSEDPAAS